MRKYNRIMAGAQSRYVEDCIRGGYIGCDFGLKVDMTGRLPDKWRDFNNEFRPIYLQAHPKKSKIAAGLACGMTWTLSKGLKAGDVILTPDGGGSYHVGEIAGEYQYCPDGPLPHRRAVTWHDKRIDRSDMSHALQRSTNSTGTCCEITQYHDEIDALIGGQSVSPIFSTDKEIEDPSVFALEKHLEDFLVANWASTVLGTDYSIYKEGSELVGQQYLTDTGPMDILAISKDGNKLLVVELKKGRASDSVVGQIQRYMGYVRSELAEPHQSVEGIIIALDDDLRIRRALEVASGIRFYRYVVSFSLTPA
jgi:restriction system protein